ncbi:MAG: hypothetical protein MJZ37_00460 [Bacilli bacterium]|nr:hypothetical protein [Bacilli bacterium]
MFDKYVKIDDRIYYESQMELMSEKQLYALIDECKNGIKEIEIRKNDYKVKNYDVNNLEHYNKVLQKFDSASVYLQSDIVLINKIIKAKRTAQLGNNEDWYKTFIRNTKSCITKRKFDKIVKETDASMGFKLNYE